MKTSVGKIQVMINTNDDSKNRNLQKEYSSRKATTSIATLSKGGKNPNKDCNSINGPAGQDLMEQRSPLCYLVQTVQIPQSCPPTVQFVLPAAQVPNVDSTCLSRKESRR